VEAQNIVTGSNNNITTTDHGAVQAGLNVANNAVSSNQQLALASINQVVDLSKASNANVLDMAKLSATQANKAWESSSKLAVSTANNAANMVLSESAANADRVEKLALAISTNGENLASESFNNNLKLVAGVAVFSLLAIGFIAYKGGRK